MKKTISVLFTLGVLLAFSGMNVTLVSCKKTNHDSIPLPPGPTPPAVPPPLVSKVDIYYAGSVNGYGGSWQFSYDSQKRVVRIADNASQAVTSDTVFYYFDYTGNDTKPYRLRSYQVNPQVPSNPPQDTVFFTYDAQGRLSSDRVMRAENIVSSSSFTRRLRTRNYSYNSGQTVVDWMAIANGETQPRVYRTDSLTMTAGNISSWVVRVPYTYLLGNNGGSMGNYIVKVANNYSAYKNPLSTSNIAGNPFLWLRKRAEIEIMGNWTYTAFWNSTVLPDLFDLSSTYLPSASMLQNFLIDGTFLNTNTIAAEVAGTPNGEYPGIYRVGPTTGGVQAFTQEYRFTYQ